MEPLRIALWNGNSPVEYKNELEFFLDNQGIKVMLMSETRITRKEHLTINEYKICHTQHSSSRDHAGTAIIIKSTVIQYKLPSYYTKRTIFNQRTWR